MATPTPNAYFQYAFYVTKGARKGYYVVGTVSAASGVGFTVYDNINDGNGDSKAQIGDVTGDQYEVSDTESGTHYVTKGVYVAGNNTSFIGTYEARLNGQGGGYGEMFLYTNKYYMSGATVKGFKANTTGAVTLCYAAGTLIRTARGDVPVETLTVGDLAVTASGARRPIRWLGHRALDCRAHPRPSEALPIRIAADAFGPNRPTQDLFVSPGHSICVDVLGEVLVPAVALANGSTVAQVEVDSVEYWHVELDSHDILVANGLPAESYLDMGNRDFFVENEVVAFFDISPDADLRDAARRSHADFCRPYVESGSLVAAIRDRLRARATDAGWRLAVAPLAGLHLVVDGTRIAPQASGLSARFVVPATATAAWLVCETAVPRDVLHDNDDARHLGVAIGRIGVDDGLETRRQIALDDPRLDTGFHAAELDRRWTSGRALLPGDLWKGCEGHFFLRIDLADAALPHWVAPASGSVMAANDEAGVRAA